MPSSEPDITDEHLMARLSRRDEAAFGMLYDRFAPRLLGLATAVLKDRREAEDILQESFLFFWNKADQFDPSRGSAFAWAALTVRHRAIDRLRSLARRRPDRLGEAIADIPEPSNTLAPDLAASQRDRHESAIALLNGLPQEQRDILQLAFLSGLTHAEISKRLDLPLGSVKTAIRRGLQRLRKVHPTSPEQPS